MNTFVLYSKFTSPTGRALRESLGIEGGVKPPKKIPGTLLRWGTSAHSDLDDEVEAKGGVVYNPSKAVARISNRQHMMHDLHCALGHDKVPLYNGRICRLDAASGITLLRHRFSKWGSDIVAVKNDNEDFWSQDFTAPKWDGYFPVAYWPGDYEVRVHIVAGKSTYFQYKALREGVEPKPDGIITVRNNHGGWGLYPLPNEKARELGIKKRELRDVAKRTIEQVRLTYGVVDFLVRSGGEYRVLEVNTGPGLEEASVARYTTAFKNMLGSSNASFDEELPELPPVEAPTLTPRQTVMGEVDLFYRLLNETPWSNATPAPRLRPRTPITRSER